MPPTYLLASILVMIVFHLFLPGLQLLPVPWTLLGILPLAGGLVASTLAEKQFHTAGTTVKPFIQATSLITDGFFRYSRNPMYLGFILVLVGIGTIMGSLTPWLVIPIFIVLIHARFIRIEEQMMQDTFGDAWREYTRKTRRWI
jgi:protein-S-isoprenylcysteine O-methyltransferase Ste14